MTAVPAFVKAAPGYQETFAANPGGDGPTYYPDWSCPALEEFTLAFYREFAARYDADLRLCRGTGLSGGLGRGWRLGRGRRLGTPAQERTTPSPVTTYL